MKYFRMRIAIITSGILPVPAVKGGAVENLVEFYINENEKTGIHDITVYSVRPDGNLPELPQKHTRFVFVNVHSFCGRLIRLLYSKLSKVYFYHPYVEFFLWRIKKDISRKKYDKIILENRPAFAPILRRLTKSRIITHLHTDTINPEETLAKEWLENMDEVWTISEYIKKRVLSVKNDIGTEVVMNGVNLSHFDSVSAIERGKIGFSTNDFVLVYFGRIIPEKGVEEVIQSMLKLMSCEHIKLLVIGSSFYDDTDRVDPFVEKIRTMSHPLKDRILFTGYVPYSQIPAYLKTCDVAILPSLCEEAFGLSMLEAMACGVPVISTNAGGIPEVCGKSAFLFERNEALVDNIVGAVKQLQCNKNLYETIKESGLRQSRLFGSKRYAERMMSLLSK